MFQLAKVSTQHPPARIARRLHAAIPPACFGERAVADSAMSGAGVIPRAVWTPRA